MNFISACQRAPSPIRLHDIATRLLTWSCFSLLLLPSLGRAQDPAITKRPPMIEIEAQFVRSTPQQLHDALGGKVPGNDQIILTADELTKTIAALKAANADFFSHSRAITKSGKQASVESVRELRYPTQYEPAKDDATKFIPTAFETRNEGVTLEVEPVVDPGENGALTLGLVFSVVKFLGFIDYSVAKPGLENSHPDALGELTKAPLKEGGIWQPIFSTQKVTTSVAMYSGQTFLSSATVAPGDPNPKGGLDFSVFITARIIAPK